MSSLAHSLKMPVGSEGKNRPPSKNDLLMKEIGSDLGFDPFPPEHYLCFKDENFTISPKAHRVLAVVYEGTIRKKDNGRSARANLPHGKPMTRAHIAAVLGVTSVSAEITELERAGFIRIDLRGHFWLRGKLSRDQLAPEGQMEGEIEAGSEGQTEGEEGERDTLNEDERKFCTRFLPEYMWLHFQQLNKNGRQQVQHRILGVKGAYDRALREVTEQLREIRDQAQDRDLIAFGFAPRRNKNKDQAAGAPVARLQLLVDFENLVQNPEYVFVQDSGETLYTAPNGSVHNSPPYISSETENTEKTLSASPSVLEMNRREASASASPSADSPETPPPPPGAEASTQPAQAETLRDDIATVTTAVRAESIQPDPSLARQIIEQSRNYFPAVTAQDIAQAIRQKGPQARKAANPAGFLFRVIPKLFENGSLEEWRPDAPPAPRTSLIDRILQGEE